MLDVKASTRPGSITRAPWFLFANQTPEPFQPISNTESEHPPNSKSEQERTVCVVYMFAPNGSDSPNGLTPLRGKQEIKKIHEGPEIVGLLEGLVHFE